MRRSRIPLTAWPAFADLMTILAVVGLAIAGLVATTGPDGADPSNLKATIEEQERTIEEQEETIAEREQTIEEQEETIARLQEQATFSAVSCLGSETTEGGVRPVPLVRLVVNSGFVFVRLWSPGSGDEEIPELEKAIAHGDMDLEDFMRYAGMIYRYGRGEHPRGPCSFFVEVKPGPDSRDAFPRALGFVNDYFLASNSQEVNQLLKGSE